MSNLTIFPSINTYGRGISEFTPGDYVHTGRCTWASLQMIYAAYQNRAPSFDEMVDQCADGYKRGYCTNINGATTLAKIAAYAHDRLALPIKAQWNYQEPLSQDWHGLIDANAGHYPILMQVAYGSRLIDAQTGVRDEAAARGLRYHAIAIVGKEDAGYVCADSDHPQVTSRFQVYAYDLRDRSGAIVNSLRAAVPCGLLMLDMPTPKPIPVPKPVPPPAPAPKPAPPPADPYKAALQTIAALAESALLK
jgi:hypothetical protein